MEIINPATDRLIAEVGPLRKRMIAVTGEALIDLVIGYRGKIRALTKGGPFDTARTIGRLGLALGCIGRLSDDGFGRTLRARVQQAGATILVPEPAAAPTTLAVAEEEAPGKPRYRFYVPAAWRAGNSLGGSDLHRTAAIGGAMRLAAETTALTCTRPRAEPPLLSELPVQPAWVVVGPQRAGTAGSRRRRRG